MRFIFFALFLSVILLVLLFSFPAKFPLPYIDLTNFPIFFLAYSKLYIYFLLGLAMFGLTYIHHLLCGVLVSLLPACHWFARIASGWQLSIAKDSLLFFLFLLILIFPVGQYVISVIPWPTRIKEGNQGQCKALWKISTLFKIFLA